MATTTTAADDDKIVDVQLSETKYFYENLRASEAKKRPAVDFMETIQPKYVNASRRAVLVDWLVDVADGYNLAPETLHLAINYLDRYLSCNPVVIQKLQLLGVGCMMIASKYEDIRPLQVEDYCFLMAHKCTKDEVLQMESSVLNFFKFEMTAPTVKSFLGLILGFLPASAQGNKIYYLASYISELSLLEYNMLCYAPSLVAASAIFLARFLLTPSQKPWSSYLTRYTWYQPSDLLDCVKALHAALVSDRERPNPALPTIRNKYSQHSYKCVAEIPCPGSIPLENFDNIVSSSLDGQIEEPPSRDGHVTILVQSRSRKSSKTNFGTTGISRTVPVTKPRSTKNRYQSRSRMGLSTTIQDQGLGFLAHAYQQSS
uniref:cyclin-A1-4-like n=1 Tax=Erigeron canadensis TaxID=72917 RepID=UPI001CB9464E|nr:cyclin-A1-4-like [Erigeron canadensis]